MTDSADWDNDILGEDAMDDEVIELTDIVQKETDTDDEAIIELTDVVEETPEDLDLDLDMDDDEPFLMEGEVSPDADLTMEDGPALDVEDQEEGLGLELDVPETEEDLGLDLDTQESPASEVSMEAASEPSVSMADLEAALERVIEKKFSDKIETILFEVMERLIEKEIAQIKNSLQKDLDEIDNG